MCTTFRWWYAWNADLRFAITAKASGRVLPDFKNTPSISGALSYVVVMFSWLGQIWVSRDLCILAPWPWSGSRLLVSYLRSDGCAFIFRLCTKTVPAGYPGRFDRSGGLAEIDWYEVRFPYYRCLLLSEHWFWEYIWSSWHELWSCWELWPREGWLPQVSWFMLESARIILVFRSMIRITPPWVRHWLALLESDCELFWDWFCLGSDWNVFLEGLQKLTSLRELIWLVRCSIFLLPAKSYLSWFGCWDCSSVPNSVSTIAQTFRVTLLASFPLRIELLWSLDPLSLLRLELPSASPVLVELVGSLSTLRSIAGIDSNSSPSASTGSMSIVGSASSEELLLWPLLAGFSTDIIAAERVSFKTAGEDAASPDRFFAAFEVQLGGFAGQTKLPSTSCAGFTSRSVAGCTNRSEIL